MITKTSIAALVAVLIGSASVALANDQFDVTIYRPAIQDNALGAFAQSPSVNGRGNGGSGPSKVFSAEEKAMFDRAQGAAD
jgi:hypothetical protein